MAEHMPERVELELSRSVDLIAEELRARGRLSVKSEPRMLGLFQRFGSFARRAFGVGTLGEISVEQVEAFIRASTDAGLVPSVATMRLRRSALRLLFRTGRELGLVSGDPSLDLVLPSTTNESARPLTDEEVDECRRVCLENLESTRLSVSWALGEATARTAEIPYITVRDVDLASGRVWIHGSRKTEHRWGAVTEWGARQVARHIRGLGDIAKDTAVAYSGPEYLESRRSCEALRETLQRAGLADDGSVRATSLAAWAGVGVWRTTRRIEAVALALGVRSLDAAARVIAWDWTISQSASSSE